VPTWVTLVIAVVGGVLVLWLALIALLWVQQRRTGSAVDWRAMMRLVPDVVRLVKRLATDPKVPRGTRWWLVALLGYLLLPFDLVPDFIPVIGFADDAVIVAIVLRFAIRHAGMDAIERHWPGSPEGLVSVLTLAGLGPRKSAD
jgi:uncharacterized membrane protein YkvA (DUF1232 family)